MRWPAVPLEHLPYGRFSPPHCPWPACPDHFLAASSHRFRYHRHGFFRRRSDGRRIVRFRCLRCRRTFSSQSFAFSYYLKKPLLSTPIAAGLNAGSAHRQLARSLRCAASSVARRAARLGRHAILLLARALDALRTLPEPIVYDDFETFVASQDTPLGIGTAVGQHSWFVYSLGFAPHRRSGRLTPAQRRRQPRLPPLPRATGYLPEARQLFDLLGSWNGPIELLTDGRPDYVLALRTHPVRRRLRHEVHPTPPRGPKGSPPSPRALARDRALFAVDLLHKIIRHTQAHHRRETIAFGRRLEAVLERGFLLAVWRNFVKARSERRPREGTPAMKLGLAARTWRWETVLSRRLFRRREQVPEPWARLYERKVGWPDPAGMKPLNLINAA